MNKYKPKSLSIGQIQRFFLYIYIVLLPIGTGLSGIVGNISIINYFSLGIAIFGMVQIIHENNFRVSKKCMPTIAYYLFTVISIAWSSSPNFNWYFFTNFVNFIVLFVIILTMRNEKDMNDIFKCIMVSQIIVFVVVIMNIRSVLRYRLVVTISSSIGISDFTCGLCLIISLWMYILATNRSMLWRVISALSLLLDTAIIFMSGSRGALSMLISMVVVWIFVERYSIKSKIAFCILIILSIYLYFSYFINLLPSSVSSRLTLASIISSHGSGRFNVWRLAIDTYLNSNFFRIVFGYGFNSFLDVVQYGNYGGVRNLLAHNIFIQTMIEGGLIGLFFLIHMIFTNIKMTICNKDNIMLIALVGLFISSLSIDMQVTRIWGLILSLNLYRNAILSHKKSV